MSSPTWPALLNALLAGKDLTAAEAGWAMRQVMADDVEPVALAGFLVALRAKGETAQEMAGMIEAILSAIGPVPMTVDAVDVVGTGGDQAHTVNISTMAAIVVAAAGIPVIKHGGRSVSSSSGSADVLEALGIRLDLSPADAARCLDQAGICYLFAPHFHRGLRHASPIRRTLGVPTVINYIAPLVNPAQPRFGCVGCANADVAPVLAEVLAARGCTVLVVRGNDGLDEISTATSTRVWVVKDQTITSTLIDAADFGLPRSQPADLRGGDAHHNAVVVRRLVEGEAGPIRDAVLINAAAAIASYRGLNGALHDALAAGLGEAAAAIDSGGAKDVLDRWAHAASIIGT
ncbi:anthranilate phosphoribosyltransferase [Actinoallomurus iriomotensis]|uniref:Anthranilate phosphoribosyltransferase n=1 Tax=Actinoallomurus iriomotensis TaxID=478107 RepID=A0A9W6RQ11_9ACTN|nr:anthranilate phosphoribosyltransferase [Actinoallomurus iriomotensis]